MRLCECMYSVLYILFGPLACASFAAVVVLMLRFLRYPHISNKVMPDYLGREEPAFGSIDRLEGGSCSNGKVGVFVPID